MPRVGLLSDSHGRADITRRAAQLLAGQGVEVLIHLGDVGAPAVLDQLVVKANGAAEAIPAHVVFGNVDYDAGELALHATRLGLRVDHPVGWLALNDAEAPAGDLVFMHGHDSRAMAEALAGQVRYLCHGHTHAQRDERVRATRVINPGALCRARVYSVALLDTARDDLRFLEIS